MSSKDDNRETATPTNQYGLTGLQWEFVQRYPACDFNGTKAAVAAGYKGKRPDMWASRTLRKPKVRAAMQDMLEEDTQVMSLTRQRILQEWMSIAFFNLQDIGDNPGAGFSYEQFSKLPRSVVAAIESVDHTVGKDGNVKMGVKIGKTKALTMLTKMMGLLEPAARDEGKGAFEKWWEEQQDDYETEKHKRESAGEEDPE